MSAFDLPQNGGTNESQETFEHKLTSYFYRKMAEARCCRGKPD